MTAPSSAHTLVARAAALVSASALAMGCGGGEEREVEETTGRGDSDAMPVTRAAGSRDEPTAGVGGTLAIDEDRGCVLLSGSPVVWPAGTSLARNPLGVRLPDGRVVRPGDRVSGGGGSIPVAAIESLRDLVDGEDVSRLRRCAGPDADVTLFAAAGDVEAQRA